MTKSNKVSKGKGTNYLRDYSNTDLAAQESEDCDVIDQFAAYEQTESNKDLIVPALAMRSYHLPGYSDFGDWLQYFQNNHPIFSICYHHASHPVSFSMRLLQLMGSIVVGLLVTNIFWLWFHYSGSNQGKPAAQSDAQSNQSYFEITQGMVMLWTIGSLLHAVFDNTAWYISACVCCISSESLGSYRSWRMYLIVVSVLTVSAVATLAVLLLASAGESQGATSVIKFLVSFAIELALALFVYYPLVATILFSGILGCGSVPVLGGQPYEVKMEAKRSERKSNASFPAPFDLPSISMSHSSDIEAPPVRSQRR